MDAYGAAPTALGWWLLLKGRGWLRCSGRLRSGGVMDSMMRMDTMRWVARTVSKPLVNIDRPCLRQGGSEHSSRPHEGSASPAPQPGAPRA